LGILSPNSGAREFSTTDVSSICFWADWEKEWEPRDQPYFFMDYIYLFGLQITAI
jgi:hypothetical protein